MCVGRAQYATGDRPRSRALVLLAPSAVMGTAGTTVAFGRRKMGLGGTWNQAVIFRGRGVPGFPSQFRIVPSSFSLCEVSRRDPDFALVSC
jgi:hypothetical protein